MVQASDIYQSATPSLVSKSLELHLAALNLEATEQVAEKAVALALASDNRYDLGDVLKTPGVSSKITGKAAELVKLFTDADELEAVSQGQKWAQDNSSYIQNFGESRHIFVVDYVSGSMEAHPSAGIPQFTSELVVRKLRLIALATLCGRSASKQVSYSEAAQAISVPESEVEAWVIDGKSTSNTTPVTSPDSLLTCTPSYPSRSHQSTSISTQLARQDPIRLLSRYPSVRFRGVAKS